MERRKHPGVEAEADITDAQRLDMAQRLHGPSLADIREVEHTSDLAELNEMLDEGGRLIAMGTDPYGAMHAYVGYAERMVDLDPELDESPSWPPPAGDAT